MKRLLYKLARKIIVFSMNEGTQLTPMALEHQGWIYRDGYWVDPKAGDHNRVYIKFQAGSRYDRAHYYNVYHTVKNTQTTHLSLFATASTVEWLETHLLAINNKSEKLT